MLVAVIVIQTKGTGLGSAWGGTGESYHTKRGVEKILFIVTIVLAALFLLTSIANILL
jgi:preprotein translocase subunit SecG